MSPQSTKNSFLKFKRSMKSDQILSSKTNIIDSTSSWMMSFNCSL